MSKANDAGLQLMAIIMGAITVLILGIVALNWWIIMTIQGNAQSALAGGFLAAELFFVLQSFEMVRKWLDSLIARFRFRDNADENRQVAELAILSQKAQTEGARGDKERSLVRFNETRDLEKHITVLTRRIKELESNEIPDSVFFDDNGFDIIEGWTDPSSVNGESR